MSAVLKLISSAIDSGAGTAILNLGTEYAIDEAERQALDYCKSYYRSYREMPTVSLVTENTGIRLPRPNGPVGFNLDNVYDRHDYEILRGGYTEMRELMKNTAPGPVIQSLEGTLRRIRRTRRKNTLIDAHQGMELVIERLRVAQRMGGVTGIPSPWDYITNQTGGWQDSDLITFVGRAGMGKTAMLLAQMEFAYEMGYSSLLVTTEMSDEQMVRRWMTLRYGLNGALLKKGWVSTHLLRRMEQWQSELMGRERFRILPVGTGAQVNVIEAAMEECQPDIVFVDGAYLLRPSATGAYMKMHDKVTAVYDELKQLTIDSKRPVVSTTQLNRQAGKGGKDASLETIGLSDAIGWHSSIVIATKYGPTENPRESRELEFLKGREGEHGSVAINFKFRPVNFNQMTPEELESASVGSSTMEDVNADWS